MIRDRFGKFNVSHFILNSITNSHEVVCDRFQAPKKSFVCILESCLYALSVSTDVSMNSSTIPVPYSLFTD